MMTHDSKLVDRLDAALAGQESAAVTAALADLVRAQPDMDFAAALKIADALGIRVTVRPREGWA